MDSEGGLRARFERAVLALRRYRRIADLRTTEAGRAVAAEAEALLASVRRRPAGTSPSSDGPRVRLVHWNIEHGNRFDAVRRALLSHPRLARADLVLLNEVDLGMARSGNHDVAFELADALGFHAAWTPMFFELGVGRHDDRLFAGGAENRESLVGVAALSRWPIGAVRRIPLAVPELDELGFDLLRMYGQHAALAVEVLHPLGPCVAVTTHLTVHGVPEHRQRQMAALIAALAGERRPVILAGDFNTTTFRRDTLAHSLAGLCALLGPRRALRGRVERPDLPAARPREPLFVELQAAGFDWRAYNDYAVTLRLRLERLDEVEALPALVRRAALAALKPVSARTWLRLDWVTARGFAGGSGYTIAGLDHGPDEASDHLPLVAELALPTSARS